MASIEESVGVADKVVPADPAYANQGALEMTIIDKSYGQSYSAMRVSSGEDWDKEINSSPGAVAAVSSTVQEPCVKFIAQDETNTDWTKSRLTYSLPLSSAITDLCSCVAKEAGMHVLSINVTARYKQLSVSISRLC